MLQGTGCPGIFVGAADAVPVWITFASLGTSKVIELSVKLQALSASPSADP